MTLELYHYIHCPYCVRVRMALGYLNLNWKSTVLPYNDETTPHHLIGKKMLPIMSFDGKPMGESLDIIKGLDPTNMLNHQKVTADEWKKLNHVLEGLGSDVHNMAMPYWIWGPEFDDESRSYFVKKKSLKRGPFDLLRSRQPDFEASILKKLESIKHELKPFWNSSSFTIKDITLAAHLWGLFCVPEFRFPIEWYNYLMSVKKLCHFEYHAGYWRNS